MKQTLRLLLALIAIAMITGVATGNVGIRILSITSPVRPSEDATLTAQTAPNAACTITVMYMSGPSHAHGLVPKTADAAGNVSWTWRVGTRTTPGTWPVTVAAQSGGSTGTANAELVVVH